MTRHGHEVFVVRQTKFVVQLVQPIEERLRQADVLVPLLSARSAWSEMLEWEVRTALDAAQGRDGKPRLLPVRVAFDGELSPELAVILDPIPPFQWLGPQDDSRLVSELADAVHGPRRSLRRVRCQSAVCPWRRSPTCGGGVTIHFTRQSTAATVSC